MKTLNYEFFIYPENKYFLDELDEEQLQEFYNYLNGTK